MVLLPVIIFASVALAGNIAVGDQVYLEADHIVDPHDFFGANLALENDNCQLLEGTAEVAEISESGFFLLEQKSCSGWVIPNWFEKLKK